MRFIIALTTCSITVGALGPSPRQACDIAKAAITQIESNPHYSPSQKAERVQEMEERMMKLPGCHSLGRPDNSNIAPTKAPSPLSSQEESDLDCAAYKALIAVNMNAMSEQADSGKKAYIQNGIEELMGRVETALPDCIIFNLPSRPVDERLVVVALSDDERSSLQCDATLASLQVFKRAAEKETDTNKKAWILEKKVKATEVKLQTGLPGCLAKVSGAAHATAPETKSSSVAQWSSFAMLGFVLMVAMCL